MARIRGRKAEGEPAASDDRTTALRDALQRYGAHGAEMCLWMWRPSDGNRGRWEMWTDRDPLAEANVDVGAPGDIAVPCVAAPPVAPAGGGS